MDLQLDGKRAFVSGSTRGIGYAVAAALAAEGAEVVLNGRTGPGVRAAVDALRRDVPGARVEGLAADLGSPGPVDALGDRLGEVDVLVNNVGLFEVAPFTGLTDADWQRAFDVNVLSGVRLSRRLLPGMLERGWGRVVFIGSEAGVDVPADMLHYGVAKSAVLALGNGLAKLTAGTAVTVNTVVGGPTCSDGVVAAVEALAARRGVSPQEAAAAVVAARPTSLLRRFIEPGEIARTVAFLCSPLASATNGSAVRVDGGVLPTTL